MPRCRRWPPPPFLIEGATRAMAAPPASARQIKAVKPSNMPRICHGPQHLTAPYALSYSTHCSQGDGGRQRDEDARGGVRPSGALLTRAAPRADMDALMAYIPFNSKCFSPISHPPRSPFRFCFGGRNMDFSFLSSPASR